MKAVSQVNLSLCTRWMPLTQQAQTTDLALCGDRAERKEKLISEIGKGRLVGTVRVGDPVSAVTTLLRAAWEMKSEASSDQFNFDNVVVMAQMPHTEAEELAARVLLSLKKTANRATLPAAEASCGDRDRTLETANVPHIDLIISEAQSSYITPDLKLYYARESAIPVVAPRPAWYIKKDELGLLPPISTVEIESGRRYPDNARILTNKLVADDSRPSECRAKKDSLPTMAELLEVQLHQLAVQKPSADLSHLEHFWNDCEGQKACHDSVMMQFLLKQIQRSSHADVVLLENRDFYFGPMLKGYEGYGICRNRLDNNQQVQDSQDHLTTYCSLRVALDRVLWKGDFSERVMVDGKTLQLMLATAQQESDDEQTLAARDTRDEWLMTFGIATKPPQNLSGASMGPATFTVPGVDFCTSQGTEAGTSQYCINGQKVTNDGAYWVSTSDHLADDNQVYKAFTALETRYHLRKKGLFVTGEIADEVCGHGTMPAMKTSACTQDAHDRETKETSKTFDRTPDAQSSMSEMEKRQQKRPILQLDYAKVVAGFMVRRPSESDAKLSSNFSGVADSRATTPHAQELDLEAVTRMTRGLGVGNWLQRFNVGIQSDLEYDRAVTGNLSGSETVTYALNSFTTGGFLQMKLFGKLLPRLLLVAAPYQFQQQITGNYLNFKFTTGTGQITVATPRWEGFSQRLGARWEFGGGKWPDTGSYIEAGPEYSVLNNVLSGLLLPNGFVCQASAVAFATCVASNTTVTAATRLKPLTETLHTGGAYWDVHLQKALDKAKRFSVTVETKGDNFMLPGVTLPTQSRYAFTTSGALNFAVIGNLVFSPTYTTFFYKNQGTPDESHSLVTNTFSVTAKWYFARDAAVPFWRQLWFRGPASLDQTKSARMK
jgi:hypothetical protein